MCQDGGNEWALQMQQKAGKTQKEEKKEKKRNVLMVWSPGLVPERHLTPDGAMTYISCRLQPRPGQSDSRVQEHQEATLTKRRGTP